MSKTTKSTTESNKPAKASEKSAGRPPRADRVEQNGFTHPRSGVTLQVWQLCDKLAKTSPDGRPVRAEVLAQAEKLGLNPNMAASQFAWWRGFHGIVGRTAKPKAPKAPKAGKGKKDAGSKAVAAVKGSKAPKAPKAPAAPVPPAPVAPVPPAPAA